MADNAHAPDDAPLTRPSAGEPTDLGQQNSAEQDLKGDLEERVERAPRLFVVAVAILAVAASVANFALGQPRVGVTAASIGLLAIGAGLSWLSMERRRVRQAERELVIDRTTVP
jgi:hypothetical protein